MPNSNVQQHEKWFSACPAFKGQPLGTLPPAYREWILSAPVLVLDKDGDATSFSDPAACRVQTSSTALQSSASAAK